MAQIIVTGYPRSGNTWLSWLLGDVLNCPVGGMYHATPLCTEGKNRPRRHYVAQLHLRPVWDGKYDKAVPNAWRLFVPKMQESGYKFCHVVRDPRDVAISIWHYWNRVNLDEALRCMIEGDSPLKVHLSWNEHLSLWREVDVPFVRYEDLQADTAGVLTKLLRGWGVKYDPERIGGAIERQSFASKKKQIEVDADNRPYNIGIHRHNLRKGVAGDWRNHFTPEQEEQAREAFGEVARELGYEL